MTIREIYSRQDIRSTHLVPLIFLGLIITGCGVKGPPRPITPEAPPQIQDLGIKVRPNGVELTWSIPEQLKPDSKEGGYSFTVLKSDLNWENRSCLDCPAPSQREILNIDVVHPEPARLQGRQVSWIDTTVSPKRAYRYQVAIQDKKEHQLSLSNPAIAKVLAPPPTPKGVVVATDNKGIMLRWKAFKKDEHGQTPEGELHFSIERRQPGGAWEQVSNVPANGNSFLDPAVASNQVYEYRLFPVLVFEQTPIYGEPTAAHQARAPQALPPPPPNTVWAIPVKGGLEIHWVESEGKVSGYHVYRREGKEITRLTAGPIQHPPYMDRSAKPNEIYYYAVSSVSPQPEQKEGLLSKWMEIRSYPME